MNRTSSRALRAAAWIALASAPFIAPGAATAAAAAADIYLKLGDIKGEIAVESFSWGATQAAGRVNKIDAFTIKQSVKADDVGEARAAAAGSGGSAVGGGAGLTIGVGTPGNPADKVSYQDISAPSMTSGKPGAARLPPELPVMAGTVESGASGLPTGKRQHKPMTITKELDKSTPILMQARPLAAGSLTVRGRLPGCAPGTAYEDAVLRAGGYTYELKEVIITSCAVSGSGGGGGSGGALPMESISLNYAKIRFAAAPQDPAARKVEVRGWDPEKKEE